MVYFSDIFMVLNDPCFKSCERIYTIDLFCGAHTISVSNCNLLFCFFPYLFIPNNVVFSFCIYFKTASSLINTCIQDALRMNSSFVRFSTE